MSGIRTTRCFYSTQPLLAWILNHYFYGDIHYVWCAEAFHPYRLKNPKSSNPYRMYSDLFEPAIDGDPYDRYLIQIRQSLRVGVHAKKALLGPNRTRRLKKVCSKVESPFLAPIVYQVLTSSIASTRRVRDEKSGAMGSDEWLVSDLRPKEFSVLFADCLLHAAYNDPDVAKLLKGDIESTTALRILERRTS